ncbi:hypothetical protein T07_14065 [Trichinella nelsoni]|uniref:Uncharacterized protein n=1 Tax=Trichinella nelsoni TaxID=6336 RepID=A0A0V0S9T7_9BILA|nr:hypothetical protein T07_14065 [Trichinella nelsoni]
MAQFLYQTIVKSFRHFSKDYEKLINCKYKRQSASAITHKLSSESDQPQPENHCSKPMNPMDAAFDVWKKKE